MVFVRLFVLHCFLCVVHCGIVLCSVNVYVCV